MAYVEVWKEGTLLSRRPVDDAQAAAGLVIRLGSAGHASLKAGQRVQLGAFELRAYLGSAPSDTDHPRPAPPAQPAERPGDGPDRTEVLDTETVAETVADEPADESLPVVEGYRVVGSLGQGGMGKTWKAFQLSTQRPVALKFLQSDTVGSEEFGALFEHEIQLCARLEHPNIARIYDSGLHHHAFYYATELVEGATLDRYVRAHHMGVRQIVEQMRTICQAVDYAHKHGVIHRNLTPNEIIVGSDRQPRLLDCGLARTLEAAGEVHVAAEGDVSGAVAYLAPEQASGHHDQVDGRTDVYALGAILYYLVARQHHHAMSGTHFEILKRIVDDEPRRPRLQCKAVDGELEAVLLKALARRSADRYASAGLLAADLDHYLKDEPLMARARTAGYVLRRKVHKHRLGLLIATTILLLASGTVALFLGHVIGRKPPAAPQEKPIVRADPQRAEQEQLAAREALDRNLREARELEEELARERKRQAEQAAMAETRPTQQPPEAGLGGPPPPAVPDADGWISLFDGKSLGGWEKARSTEDRQGGEVKLQDGTMVLGTGAPATVVVWNGDAPKVDYELTLEACRTSGSRLFCDVAFPVEAGQCSLQLGGYGRAFGLHCIDGKKADGNSTTGNMDFENGRWYRVRIRVTKGKIESWIDSEKVIEFETAGHVLEPFAKYEPNRPLRLLTWDTTGAFRGIRLRRLDGGQAFPEKPPVQVAWPFDAKDAARRQDEAARDWSVSKEDKLDLGAGVEIKLVLIPPGAFMMGTPDKEKDRRSDEGGVREVTISRPFYMGIHEVTRTQYLQFVSYTRYRTACEIKGSAPTWDGKGVVYVKGAYWKNPPFSQAGDHPVAFISYDDAAAFCRWLSQRTGKVVRLSTEAEWEYACRGGSSSAFSFGEDGPLFHKHGNCSDKSPNDGHDKTAPVGSFLPNAFGLYDMHGNLFEWCSDWHEGSYRGGKVVDPSGPASGSKRVMRGGCHNSPRRDCRSGSRRAADPSGTGGDSDGFRIVVELEKSAQPPGTKPPSPPPGPEIVKPSPEPVPGPRETPPVPVAQPVTAAMTARARESYKSLFAPEEARVLGRGKPAESAAFAAKLLAAARNVNDQKALQILLCEKACELGVKSLPGHATAADAMRMLAEVAPERKTEAHGRLLDVLQQSYARSSGEARAVVGEQLVQALISSADEQASADPAGAVVVYRRALSIATAISSPRVREIMDKVRQLGSAQQAERRLAAMKQTVAAQPGNTRARTELILAYLGEFNNPVEAAKLVSKDLDEHFRTYVPLAAKPVGELGEGPCLELSSWYAGLAEKAATPCKVVLLQRAKDCGERYLKLHSAQDSARLKAELLLEKIRTDLDRTRISTLPGQLTLELDQGVTMKCVLIPAGKFLMGSPPQEKDRQPSEGPQREVTVSRPFYMGAFEVTQEQYQAVMGSNPSKFQQPKNPVERVTWTEAVDFCGRLSAKWKMTVRLPTEAEWEYACRAGGKTRFAFGDDENIFGDHAWYSLNSERQTHPVGQKKANAFGLYDILGNVWELCDDWISASYADLGSVDPKGPASGSGRVMRGGSYLGQPYHSRSAHRCSFKLTDRNDSVGFRVVVEVNEK